MGSNNNQFKLIAIEPLEGCAPYILKNLKVGEKYYFYQGYEIIRDKISINDNEILDAKFFSEGDTNISIHAIVGKNGSGKSNLIDLLLRVINNLSCFCYGIGRREKNGDRLIFASETYVKLYYMSNKKTYCIESKNKEVNISMIKNSNSPLSDTKTSNLNEEYSTSEEIKEFIKENFFYTLSVNYSLYAYNSYDYSKESWSKLKDDDIENNTIYEDNDARWLDGLFHKNDGYKVPIVLNPYREKGVIDINNEKHLTYSRFISLMIDDEKENRFLKINKNKIVKSISLYKVQHVLDKFNIENAQSLYEIINLSKENELDHDRDILEIREKIEEKNKNSFTIQEFNKRIENIERNGSYILNEWSNQLFGTIQSERKFSVQDIKNNHHNWYIITKTIKAANKYKDILGTTLSWERVLDDKLIENEIRANITFIIQDKSHITLKLRQALTYKYFGKEIYNKYLNKDAGSYSVTGYCVFTVDKFNRMINDVQEELNKQNLCDFLKEDKLSLLVPPFIPFKIDIEDINTKKSFSFDSLSSGEKQLIYSITTILYHLRNINSAHKNTNRVKYNYVNIILDEIELCYHPEMQRRQISELIYAINTVKFDKIHALNICLITHSPMILSDIPNSNILFLDDGEARQVKDFTFGANIHSLYKHSFFMDLPMGEFAKRKIGNLFNRLREKCLSSEDLENIKREIQMVGEPLLKNQLMKLYREKCNIEERIFSLEKEVEKLKKQRNND